MNARYSTDRSGPVTMRAVPDPGTRIWVDPGDLQGHPSNPRAAEDTQEDSHVLGRLADSIQTAGLRQPPEIRPLGDGRWQILSGHRRTAAWKVAFPLGLMPAVVSSATTAAGALEVVAAGNAGGEPVTPGRRAGLVVRWMEVAKDGGAPVTLERVGRVLGLSRAGAGRLMVLARFPAPVRVLWEDGVLAGYGERRCATEALIDATSMALRGSSAEVVAATIREGLSRGDGVGRIGVALRGLSAIGPEEDEEEDVEPETRKRVRVGDLRRQVAELQEALQRECVARQRVERALEETGRALGAAQEEVRRLMGGL